MPQPQAVSAIRDELLDLYRAAWDDIEAQLLELATDPAAANRVVLRRRLASLGRSVDAAMAQLDGRTRTWLQQRLPGIYQLGAAETEAATGRRFAWEQIHRDAVQQLASDTFDDLLKSTRFVRRTTKTFIREAARTQTRRAVVGGQTATQAGRELAAVLRDRFGVDGPAAITYRNGARHGLADYADTVMRSKTAEAYNGGTLNAGKVAGVGWFEVFDGADCGWSSHQDPDKASGTIRSAADCAAHSISHPRCARGFAPRPDITSAGDAGARAPLTDQERARRAADERARAAEQDRRSRATRRRRQRTASRSRTRAGAR